MVAGGDLDADGQLEILALAGDQGYLRRPSLHVLDVVTGRLTDVWHTPPREDWDLPYAVGAGDLDADGDADVIASLGGVRRFENSDGSGTLVERGLLSNDCLPLGFEIDDLDGDGDADLVGGSCALEGPRAYALRQDQGAFMREEIGGHDGAVYAQMLHRAGSAAQRVVTAETYSATYAVWERDDGVWTSLLGVNTHERLFGVVDADLDGDGNDDFVLLRGFEGYGPLVFRQNADGSFENVLELNGDIGPGNAGDAIDVDGDGDLDLIFGSFWNGGVWLYEATGPFTYVEHRPTCTFNAISETMSTMALGRFTGDARVGLVTVVGRHVELVTDVRALFGL